ncbi:MAG: hypothetical protein WC498_03380 [Candidatus Saccharimonadales bacterium]
MRTVTRKLLPLIAALAIVAGFALPGSAATPASDFSLQVTPSPLVATVKPGHTTDLELKVRNGGTGAENLKIEVRSFSINNASGQVALSDTTQPEIATWVTFSAPTFTVQSGQWFTEKIHLALPNDTGFSYSFAMVISRQANPKPTQGGRLIKGSVAIFTLINVDRPGATRKLSVTKFTASRGMYEYLPTTLDIKFYNQGNSIVQPYGNIFLQRSGKSTSPLATLPVNETRGYILPGTERTLSVSWDDGFPAYKRSAVADGSTQQKLAWNWSKLSSFRIGHYTAKLVAVYNDGQRDVPMQGEVSFWVVPWKILLGLLVFVSLLLFGLWSFIRKVISLVHHKKHKSKRTDSLKP